MKIIVRVGHQGHLFDDVVWEDVLAVDDVKNVIVMATDDDQNVILNVQAHDPSEPQEDDHV